MEVVAYVTSTVVLVGAVITVDVSVAPLGGGNAQAVGALPLPLKAGGGVVEASEGAKVQSVAHLCGQ